MITKDSLTTLLMHPQFGFTKSGNIYKRKYPQGASIEVNTDTQKITYAPIDTLFKEGEFPTKDKPARGFVIHRDTTLNFSANENFVCLVCVHLLLKKGYEPKHLVFEPAFKVGHVNKPSYGDILVFDKEYNPLVLIENKTYGTEFSKEWNLMQKDGGQLFSYLGPLVNVMGLCQNLVLFAADFDEKELILKNHIITLKDNEKRLNELENAKSFADAQGKYLDVWNQTYGKSFETKGLFEDDIAAYSVGKLKYTIKDLKGLSHAEIRPIYHEFATILRNHAITDFEHSFYILIDLFLCKITDELNNPEDLQFYYKGIARDTPKEYCNRLLKLYQLGKQQLFNVEVVNKDEEDIKQIFEDTNRSLTNGLFAGIKELFEEMKFYNIKKFNFIDVENREEFEMNFQILIKIAALIQDINLSSSETNHFFGDLFEGLLSKNVHQTEGQFFTPLPIVNFIINSLPQFPNTDKVKVLDYACGAGHFLTEFVKHYPKAKIYGIEKSQTLSQVAKIATIINGCQDSRIVFKDSLSHINTMDVRYQGFDKESFDCIIANPPYSVKGFLNTMEQKDRDQFELAKSVEEKAYSTNRSIECFFVERAQHFLKKDGLMGIVLPSSLLSNENIYTKTREIIFANFNILAIAVMNSRTFGSTGTNTVILFAQKVKKNSEGLLHTFIDKKDYTQYTTSGAIESYVQKQGYPKDEYFAFMQDGILGEDLKGTDVFKDYVSNFKKSSISKSLQKEWFAKSSYYKEGIKENSKEYKNQFAHFLSSDDYKQLEETEYRRQFIAFAKDIECRKLNVFIQTENNIVAILQSPPEKVNNKSNKAEVVKFLGYDWSNRKGDEGIKYLTSQVQETETSDDDDDKDTEIVQAINSIKYIETPLYNPGDNNDVTKYSYALRKHITDCCNRFSYGTAKVSYEKPFAGESKGLLQFSKLTDLIDYGRTTFNLVIRANVEKKAEVVRYKDGILSIGLDSIANIEYGTRIVKKKAEGTIYPVYGGGGETFRTDDYNRENRFVISRFGMSPECVRYVSGKFFLNDSGLTVKSIDNRLNDDFLNLFLYCYQPVIFALGRGIAQKNLDMNAFASLKVPLPSQLIQQKIVIECQNIDEELYRAKDKIIVLQEEIRGIVANVRGEKKKLGSIAHFKNGLNYKETYVGDTVNIVGVADFKDNKSPEWDKVKAITITENIDDSYLLHKHDLLTVRSNGSRELVGRFMLIDKEPEERTTFSGFSIRVRIVSDEVDSEFLYYLLSSANVRQRLTTGSNGANIKSLNQDLLSNLEIPLPPLSEQKKVIDKIGAIESEIASLKIICEGATARKKAILHRELIEDDELTLGLTPSEDETDKEETNIIVLPEYREGCVPLYTLRAACGYFEDGEVPEAEGWIDASGKGFTPDPKRHFAVHAKGNSMQPKIQDGDICVFEWYRAGSREGEIVLTECNEKDIDYGGMYTIKKYHSEKLVTEEGWRHTKVELLPLNKDYDVIELNGDEEYRTIGVLKCVL